MAGIGLGAIANCKGKIKMDRETEGKEGNPWGIREWTGGGDVHHSPVFHHNGTGHFKIFINISIIQSHCL